MFRWHGKFDWSDVDARYLQGFLMSSTGRKLALMVEDEVTRNTTPMYRQAERHCGLACVTTLDSSHLAASSAES